MPESRRPSRFREGLFLQPAKGVGRYLLDEQLEVARARQSPQFQKQVLKLAACLPYHTAQELLGELSGLDLSDSRIWQLTQQVGQQLEQVWQTSPVAVKPAVADDQLRLKSSPSASPAVPTPTVRKGVGMDGVMVHIRGEGYKETKLGTLFEVALIGTGDKTQPVQAKAVRQQYCLYLGGPEEFGRRLDEQVRAGGWEQSRERCVIGDGASWIWNLAAEHFKGEGTVEVVDWYHAKQHLCNAANLLFGEGSLKALQLSEAYADLLFEGCAELVAGGLEANLKSNQSQLSADKQDLILREANYFRNNQSRMEYQACRQGGWPIGSGAVESGCKLFKQRFGGSGMRWSRQGAVNLMPLRAALMGDCFDQLWESLSLCPQN